MPGVIDSRASINSIDDIQYFPEVNPVPVPVSMDPDFDRICDVLRAAMWF